MRILVIGGTGSTGTHVLRLGVERGDTMRTLARNPGKLAQDLQGKVEVVEGSFTEESKFEQAVEGVDVVISVAGDPQLSKEGFMEAFVRMAVPHMRKAGVKKFIYQSGAFAKVPGEVQPWSMYILRHTVGVLVGITDLINDNEAVALFLTTEVKDLDWTVTMPSTLYEKPSHGKVVPTKTLGASLNFVDLAQATLDIIESTDLTRKCTALAYA